MTHAEQAANLVDNVTKGELPVPTATLDIQLAQAHALVSIAESLEKLVGAMVYAKEGAASEC